MSFNCFMIITPQIRANEMCQLLHAGNRIIELSKTLAGRLTVPLIADQGADILPYNSRPYLRPLSP